MIKVGMIGCGGMGRIHLENINFGDLKGKAQLHALSSTEKSKDKMDFLGDKFGVPSNRRFTDYKEMLEFVDAVLLPLPIDRHYPVAKDCLLAGKHVLLEKPITIEVKEAEELEKIAKEKKLIFQQGFCCRYMPSIVKIKELIDSGKYGRVRQLSIWTEANSVKPSFEHWVNNPERAGGGMLMHHACHYIDMLLYFLGTPTHGSYFGNSIGSWLTLESSVNVTMKFENDAVGYYYGSFAATGGSVMEFSLQLHMEKALIESYFLENKIWIYTDGAWHSRHRDNSENRNCEYLDLSDKGNYLNEQFKGFIKSIEDGAPAYPDAKTGIDVLKITKAFYNAEKEGKMGTRFEL